MKTFLADFKFVHRRSLAFAAALPLVAAIPMVAEFIQHVIELRIGMYDSIDGAVLAERHPDRLLSGFAKTIALGLPAYFLIRWLHSAGNSRFAATFEKPAAALFALVIALQALLNWLGLFVWTEGPMAIGFFVFYLLFMPLVVRFVVAAPLGRFVSPAQSIRSMLPHAFYAILFSLAAMLPLMALHYALGIGAIFAGSETVKWAMLAFDSIVTAWLALVVTTSQYVIAIRPGPVAETVHAGTH